MLKCKRAFCSFLQVTEASYLSTNSGIIDKNMRNIYKLIHLSFLYIDYEFFPGFPYTPHKATPHLVEVCVRFVQARFFSSLFSSLLHN